jgi:3-deoxy-D-manno-octulosonic-acid transferase
MLRKTLIVLAGLMYDLLMMPVLIVFMLFAWISPKTRAFLCSRSPVLRLVREQKKEERKTVLFYCSSVGEFEQAFPLMQRMQANGMRVFVFFFSKKGLDYCRSVSTFEAYCTPHDFFISWMLLLSAHDFPLLIVNRHEFWPGAMLAAAYKDRLCIINYIHREKFSFVRSFALGLSKMVYGVNSPAIAKKKLIYSGDTRHDRLTERYENNKEQVKEYREMIRKQLKADQKLILVGNAYAEDIRLLQSIQDKGRYRFLIVPARNGAMLPDLPVPTAIGPFPWDKEEAVVLQITGKLFELYGSADLAWVGGGFSGGIHNCLEASFYGLSIISGPDLHAQPDALALEKEKKLHIFENAEQLQSVLRHASSPAREKQGRLTSPTTLVYNSIYENYYTR